MATAYVSGALALLLARYPGLPAGEAATHLLERVEVLPSLNRRAEAMACYRFDHLEGESIGDLSGSANDLWKPSRLTFDKPLLGLPEGQTFSVSDVTVNLLGFVPFGFLVCLRLLAAGRSSPRSCLIIAMAAGFSFSLAIELTQVWLPGRDSSFLHLTTNTMGSAIGGVMAGHFGRLMGHF